MKMYLLLKNMWCSSDRHVSLPEGSQNQGEKTHHTQDGIISIGNTIDSFRGPHFPASYDL